MILFATHLDPAILHRLVKILKVDIEQQCYARTLWYDALLISK